MNTKRIKVKVKSSEQAVNDSVRQLYVESLNVYLDQAEIELNDEDKRAVITDLLDISSESVMSMIDAFVDTYMSGYNDEDEVEGE